MPVLEAVSILSSEKPDPSLTFTCFNAYFSKKMREYYQHNFAMIWRDCLLPVKGVILYAERLVAALPLQIVAQMRFYVLAPYNDDTLDPIILYVRNAPYCEHLVSQCEQIAYFKQPQSQIIRNNSVQQSRDNQSLHLAQQNAQKYLTAERTKNKVKDEPLQVELLIRPVDQEGGMHRMELIKILTIFAQNQDYSQAIASSQNRIQQPQSSSEQQFPQIDKQQNMDILLGPRTLGDQPIGLTKTKELFEMIFQPNDELINKQSNIQNELKEGEDEEDEISQFGQQSSSLITSTRQSIQSNSFYNTQQHSQIADLLILGQIPPPPPINQMLKAQNVLIDKQKAFMDNSKKPNALKLFGSLENGKRRENQQEKEKEKENDTNDRYGNANHNNGIQKPGQAHLIQIHQTNLDTKYNHEQTPQQQQGTNLQQNPHNQQTQTRPNQFYQQDKRNLFGGFDKDSQTFTSPNVQNIGEQQSSAGISNPPHDQKDIKIPQMPTQSSQLSQPSSSSNMFGQGPAFQSSSSPFQNPFQTGANFKVPFGPPKYPYGQNLSSNQLSNPSNQNAQQQTSQTFYPSAYPQTQNLQQPSSQTQQPSSMQNQGQQQISYQGWQQVGSSLVDQNNTNTNSNTNPIQNQSKFASGSAISPSALPNSIPNTNLNQRQQFRSTIPGFGQQLNQGKTVEEQGQVQSQGLSTNTNQQSPFFTPNTNFTFGQQNPGQQNAISNFPSQLQQQQQAIPGQYQTSSQIHQQSYQSPQSYQQSLIQPPSSQTASFSPSSTSSSSSSSSSNKSSSPGRNPLLQQQPPTQPQSTAPIPFQFSGQPQGV